MLTRSNFSPRLFIEGLRKVFFLQYGELPLVYPEIYDVIPSRKRQEIDHTIAGVGMMAPKGEGLPLAYEDLVDGYEKIFAHTSYAKGMRITRELLDDELYGVIGKRVQALARSARYRKCYDHFLMFNDPANTAGPFLGADGLPLFSASHTLAGKPGQVVSNYASSTTLSLSALEAGFNAMRRFYDDQGLLIALEPATLLVAPELTWEAERLLNSPGKPGTADNDINSMKGKLTIKTSTFITRTTFWALLCNKSEIAPVSFERTPVEFDKDGDFDTKDLKTSAFCRYSNGFTDWRFAYGGYV